MSFRLLPETRCQERYVYRISIIIEGVNKIICIPVFPYMKPNYCRFYLAIVCMDLVPTDFNLFSCQNFDDQPGRCHDVKENGKCKETWIQNKWDKCAPSMASKALQETCKASCGTCGMNYFHPSI